MKNRFITGMAAAMAAVTLISGSPVYAAEETAAETSAETNEASKEYILLLPKHDGVSYSLDESHVSEQYSSENYTVLLYKEGEQVDLTVSGAKGFYVKDALDTEGGNLAEGTDDGKLSFTMPAGDIALTVPEWGIETEAETEAQTESQTETQAGTDNAQAAGETAVDLTNIRVSKTRLNVRSAASADAGIIGLLTPGTRVKVTGTENGWCAVKFVKDGAAVDGFVKEDYLSETSSLYTAVSNVNIRSAASETAKKLGQLKAGEETVVLETGTDGWSKVAFMSNGKVSDAYIKSEFLTAETSPAVDALLAS